MTNSAESDLDCLAEGARCLLRLPWATLGLATLGMLLAALAPLIQLRAGLPGNDPMVTSTVIFVAVFPLELYFIPRFLMELDAQKVGNPLNALTDWKVRFEERWAKSFLAKLLLGVAAGMGLACLLLPGILVLLAFGWVPLRVLLRGESLLEAARGSLRTMAVAWRRMLFIASALIVVYLTLGLLVGFAQDCVLPDPTLRQRMLHPAIYLGNFIASLLSVWLSASFLALFQRLERTTVKSGL